MNLTTLLCVIPTHNRPHLVAQALDSAASQTVPPTRIVVSDDAHNAATEQIVRARAPIPGTTVEYVPCTTDFATAGASRNRGAEGATEDLIAFLDDDDRWEPRFVERVTEEFETDPQCGFVVGWSDHVTANRSFPGTRMPPGLQHGDCYAPNPGLTGSNAAYRRETFELVGGFDPKMVVSNDVDLLVRLLREGHTYRVTPHVITHQVHHDGEHLTTRSARRAMALKYYLDQHTDFMTPAQRREVLRMTHAALRGRDQTPLRRAAHTGGQLLNSSPRNLLQAGAKRLRGKPDMYNAGGSPTDV